MKIKYLFTILLNLIIACAIAQSKEVTTDIRPTNFVNIKKIIPQIELDMRYYTAHNFVGRRIVGYKAPVCLLTLPAAMALKTVENKLLPFGMTLKVYDCYRPQMAVNDFANWATQINNISMRKEFYPTVDKKNLFKDGYILYRSGHTRGSTMDLTIVPLNSKIPIYNPNVKQIACTAPQDQRTPDNSLDFGTGYDCFSEASHPDYQQLTSQQKANRLLLQTLMKQAGFKGLDTEWWHFTLINELYPDTYFNFPVN
ncbi:MAG: M15 family metallopeptidase [Burkholderiales bacterium]|nr:M15 family metallopeptidase [Burkholderiales bacterium]